MQRLPVSSCQSCALLGVTVGLWAPDCFCKGSTLVLLLRSTLPGRVSALQWLPPEFLHGATPRVSRALKIHSASAPPIQRAHGHLLSCQTRASWDLQEWVFQELTDLPLALSLQETPSLPAERRCAGEPSPICVPIIIHRCEDDFLKHSLFGLTQLPETATAFLALDFRAVDELCKGYAFLGAIVLRVSSDPSF